MRLSLDTDDPLFVELDAFSGRPNPVWELTAVERTQLAEIARKMPQQTEVRENAVEKLGYRGLIVRGSKAFDELAVYNGFIEAGGTRWIDVGRAVEAFLLTSSRRHIEKAVYKSVLSQANLDAIDNN